MRQAVLTLSAICMLCALCEQLLEKNRSFGAVRMVLGMQIALLLVKGLGGWFGSLGG